ncbi:MAG: C-terminal helicase domain-containing protein, partial [bacterium]|nr:C-terminal helicase domain-containing protein [bacterium]
DPNLAELVERLAAISAEAAKRGMGAADTRDRRKVLIFSYFSDTVDWIGEHLEEASGIDQRLAAYRGRIVSLSGSTPAPHKDAAVWGFAPRTTDAPAGCDEDRFDILVTTDVLAEGVNLQQARHIINYDLPWNPMRLVQRHGRIDRIGSQHSEVIMHCVFPDARLDDLLGLEAVLHRKLTQAAASIGVGAVLPEESGRDVSFTETREEIERLRREDASLFERGGTARGALSGEEYRQELRQAVSDGRREAIETLPWGAGSGMAAGGGGRAGYVFCAQVGDRRQPLFRFVSRGGGPASEVATAGSGSGPEGGATGGDVTSETLACLDLARPPGGFDEPRLLDEAAYRGAFDAWDLARTDIVEGWNHHADPANLQPRVPAALRRAAELLRTDPPPGLTQDDIDRSVDAICAPYPERIIRTFRAAMDSAEDPAEQAALVHRVVRDLGLEPYVPPEPLPEITREDVHLVCWLALV